MVMDKGVKFVQVCCPIRRAIKTPTRFEDAARFGKCLRDIRHVKEHVVGDNDVEARAVERESLGVGDVKVKAAR